MRGFVKSNAFKTLLMVIVITLSILTLSSTVGSASIASVFGLVTDPMTQVVSSLTEDELQKYSDMSFEELAIYVKELEEENAKLTEQLVEYYDLKVENQQYQIALSILDENSNLELLPSSVTAKDPSDPFGSFTIDVGSENGVSLNDPVITEQGLVGIVSEVHTYYAKVTTILSEDINIGASAKEYGESGVVMGNAETAINNLVKFNYLTVETQVEQGTLIVTSGASEIYPEDLVIGTVSYLGSNLEDVSMYAMVETAADIENVTTVFVITDFSVQLEMERDTESTGEEITEEVEEE